jgi:stage IV sporulation protein FB
MFLAEPPPSRYDLHLRVLGFPVRITPYFWLGAAMLGINPRGGTPPGDLLMWIAVVFVSIVVHELGHALVQRRFGGRPWITLTALGGLASCDDCDRRPRSQILISLAGPVAGFALVGLIVILLRLTGHDLGWTTASDYPDQDLGFPMLGGTWHWKPFGSRHADRLLSLVLFVNILWGLVNLLPIYPLDGGRISREVCTLRRPRQGIVLSLRISVVAAAAMAVIGAIAWQSIYSALMFGYLAYSSYTTLQSYESQRW